MNRWLPTLSICALVVTTAQAGIRDPMRPPLPAASRAQVHIEEPVVTAVFIGSERRAAIVNGQLVHEGDRIGICTIEAVLEDGIRCRHGEGTREFHLPRAGLQVKTLAAVQAHAPQQFAEQPSPAKSAEPVAASTESGIERLVTERPVRTAAIEPAAAPAMTAPAQARTLSALAPCQAVRRRATGTRSATSLLAHTRHAPAPAAAQRQASLPHPQVAARPTPRRELPSPTASAPLRAMAAIAIRHNRPCRWDGQHPVVLSMIDSPQIAGTGPALPCSLCPQTGGRVVAPLRCTHATALALVVSDSRLAWPVTAGGAGRGSEHRYGATRADRAAAPGQPSTPALAGDTASHRHARNAGPAA
jgi:hypothetical protein